MIQIRYDSTFSYDARSADKHANLRMESVVAKVVEHSQAPRNLNSVLLCHLVLGTACGGTPGPLPAKAAIKKYNS